MQQLSTTGTRRTPFGIFYGWIMLAGAILGLATYGSLFTYGFSTYFLPIQKALSTNRAALSLGFSFTRIESALLGPIEGYLVDHYGPRRIILVGYLLMGAGFIAFSTISTLTSFYIAFAFIAFGASLSGFLPMSTAVTNWFIRRRGLAMGILLSGISIGGLLVPLVAFSIETFGWRDTSFYSGFLCWAIGVPVASLMRHKPEPYGYRPDGDAVTPVEEENGQRKGGLGATTGGNTDFTVMEALRTRPFWIIALAHGFSLFIVGAVSVHLIPRVVDMGFTLAEASFAYSFLNGVAILGRVGGGFLGDNVPKKLVLIACFIMQSTAMVILAYGQTMSLVIIAIVIYGLGYGARGPMLVALRGDYFGRERFATIMGTSQLFLWPGTALGPLFAGYLFDLQGSYTEAFVWLSMINLVGIAVLLFLKPPVRS